VDYRSRRSVLSIESLHSRVPSVRGKFAERDFRTRSVLFFDSRVAVNISVGREKKRSVYRDATMKQNEHFPVRSGKDKASSSGFAARQVDGK